MKKSELQQIIREEIGQFLTENQLVKDFEKWFDHLTSSNPRWIGKDKTPTSADIDYYAKEYKLTPVQKSMLIKAFPSDDIKIKSTGPTPDTRFRNR